MPRGLFALGFVTFSAFQFQDLWDDVGETARAYDGHPLAEMNPARRGALLQEWARQMLQQIFPNSSVTDAVPGTCVNGARRAELKRSLISQWIARRWRSKVHPCIGWGVKIVGDSCSSP